MRISGSMYSLNFLLFIFVPVYIGTHSLPQNRRGDQRMLETVNFGLKLYRKNNHTIKVRIIRYYHLDKWIALAYVSFSYTHMLNSAYAG